MTAVFPVKTRIFSGMKARPACEIVYDKIGEQYDDTRCADPYLLSRIQALLNPDSDGLYLDIGCGTGNYTGALAERGFSFYGIDPSEKMLATAAKNYPQVCWRRGVAEQVPATTRRFDGAIATLTIHHWSDLPGAFAELFRVLKNKARMVVFTSTPEQMHGYWLNYYFPAMLKASIKQMPALSHIESAALAAGFWMGDVEVYNVQDDLKDHFLYAGKNRPELYFHPGVRRGISSFAALANAGEVAYGLARLKEDIDSGHFKNIQAKYRNHTGDYLFLVLQKEPSRNVKSSGGV